jgi:hypothetical protein
MPDVVVPNQLGQRHTERGELVDVNPDVLT